MSTKHTEAFVARVTREKLRSMTLGEVCTFRVPSAAAILSARATASQAARLLGCKFTTASDFEKLRITISKQPL